MLKDTNFTLEIEQETDGRWIADVQELPGVMVYGSTREVAIAKAKALALRVVADQLEEGEQKTEFKSVAFSLV